LPAPLRPTLCGEFRAVSVKRNVLVMLPWLCGVKLTPTAHDAPRASTFAAVQVDDAILKTVPERIATELIFAEPGLLDGLVSVTVEVPLV
jgi:hypothetical protein